MEVLKVSKRNEVGTNQVRHLRRKGLIPGNIYGHGEANESVSIDKHELLVALHHGERVLEVNIEGRTQNVLVKDIQFDPMGKDILHVDLTRVDLDERVTVTVTIILRGTPAGEGGVLHQNAAQANIECTVRSIPDDIRVNVAGMQIGDVVKMRDLPLPEGAKLIDDPELIVASLSIVQEVVEEAPAEAGPAEPEVIGAKKEEGEEGEEGEKPAKEEKKEKKE
jgi:large subunit ribosomal protein L25